MKIVVIGGTGLIGSKLVTKLSALGHEAVAAAPNTGVNTLTGEGLAQVLKGAQVVVDVSNSPSFEDGAVMNFFQTSTRNLLSYEAAAGVGHHVALSIVGSERVPDSGYLRAKVAQEKLIKETPTPYTIVRATQFFEFTKRIADEATRDNKVYLPPVLFQPMAADDVASALSKVATSPALNSTIEIAGPEPFRFDELIQQRLNALNDPRKVVADPHARYFGAELSERSIVPDDTAQLGETHFEDWLRVSSNQAPAAMVEGEIGRVEAGAGAVVKTISHGAHRKTSMMKNKTLLLVLLFLIPGTLMAQQPAADQTPHASVTPLTSKDLPEFPGKEVLMITVEYPPGSMDPIHRHNAHAFIYVLEGSIIMQVKGGKEVTLTPGQTFYEGPDDVHVLGRNASSTKPAKFVVFFIKDKGAPVLVPEPE